MSNMNGIEATFNVIEKFGLQQCPIIISFTVTGMAEDRARYLAAGMQAKPIRFRQLKVVLEHWEQRIFHKNS